MKALALALLAAGAAAAQPVRIAVFGLFRPARLEVRGPASAEAAGRTYTVRENVALSCQARAGIVLCTGAEGSLTSRSVRVENARRELTLAVPGRIERRFRGVLELTANGGVLVPVMAIDLEDAVAAVAAAESAPGSPRAALETQAIVARSFYSAGARHRDFGFCDTTHCQFLRGTPSASDAAARAADATRGLILTWRGAPIAALYSARCGGRTRALEGAAEGEYPFFAVACPSCARSAGPECAYCTRTTGRWANRRGSGAGHGIGLCQHGAAAMAEAGASYPDILRHYFPAAALAAIAQHQAFPDPLPAPASLDVY